jgi:hypothetical protein
MSVQNRNPVRFGSTRPTGIYLMELRRHVSELHSRRPKLFGGGDSSDDPRPVVLRLRVERRDKAAA